jgi:hypothetical protein
MFRRLLGTGFLIALVASAAAQDSQTYRGRKYKAPPATSHVEVQVLKSDNQKPIANAAVIFRSVKDGKDEGNLEVKTNEDGKAIIDVIPTGSTVDVQVIADGYATFANTYAINDPTAALTIKMLRPRAQISNYVDTDGKPSQRPVGVQEPHRAGSQPATVEPLQPTNHTSDPTPRAPVDPGATPGNSQNPTPANPETPPQAPPQPPPPALI